MRRSLAFAGALATVCAALAPGPTRAPAAAAPAPAAFTENDVYRVVGLSAPQLAPDGTRVLVTVRTADREHDRWDRRLDIVDVATRARRTVPTATGFAAPRWSPAGDRIAYIADGAVVVADANGMNAAPVTAGYDVVQFAWRPDGGAIAFVAIDRAPPTAGDDRYLDAYPVGNDSALAKGPSRAAHLYLQTLAGGAARPLGIRTGSVTSGDAESTLSWSPDGGTIAYLHAPTNVANDAVDARIRLVDTVGGQDRALPGPTHGERDPLFAPDGRAVAYVHSDGQDQLNPLEAFVTPLSGGAARNVSHPVDRAVRDLAWQPGSRTLYFSVTSGTRRVLYRSVGDDTPRAVPLAGLSISSGLDGALGRDGSLAFIGESAQRAPEVYLRTRDGTQMQLTDDNASISALGLAHSSRITYGTSTGVDGDAVLTLPPGYRPANRYPLVVTIHGGPTSASIETFDPLRELLAARGWIVLEPNYRGSNNLGARYQRAVGGDKLRGPGRDIDAAIAAVRRRGMVDGTRLAVSGWSYGAGLTLWMIERRHDWRAAVAGAAVSDIAADYATADDIAADRALVGGSPLVGRYRAAAAAMSPITYVAQVRTPLLLLTCRGDSRVAPTGVYEFYHALRDLGRPVQLIAYPIDGHFPSDPVRRTDVYRRWAGFIAQRFAAPWDRATRVEGT